MKTLIHCLIISLGLISFSIYSCNNQTPPKDTSVAYEKIDTTDLMPCCNNLDPRTNTGPFWTIYCSGGDIVIDSQCCANVWNYYGGQPPSPIGCTTVYNLCPESYE